MIPYGILLTRLLFTLLSINSPGKKIRKKGSESKSLLKLFCRGSVIGKLAQLQEQMQIHLLSSQQSPMCVSVCVSITSCSAEWKPKNPELSVSSGSFNHTLRHVWAECLCIQSGLASTTVTMETNAAKPNLNEKQELNGAVQLQLLLWNSQEPLKSLAKDD